MSVSITIEVEHTVSDPTEATPVYSVMCEIAATVGIDLALFVYNVTSKEFSHPATVFDMESYPVGQAEAINQGLDYYRQATVTQEFSTISDANAFDFNVRSRLQRLANDYPQAQGLVLAGTQTYVITTATT